MSDETFEEGKIKAEVGVFSANPGRRGRGSPHKVRVTILSGPDFRLPHIVSGRICADRPTAMAIAAEAVRACKMLGIPVIAPALDEEPLLGPVPEDGTYPSGECFKEAAASFEYECDNCGNRVPEAALEIRTPTGRATLVTPMGMQCACGFEMRRRRAG